MIRKEVDPRYIFRFVAADGRNYQRQVYWENLYAFFPGRERVLAAARMTPHQNMHHALFQVLRSKGKQVRRQLIPQTSRGRDEADFISSVTEMIHYRSSSPPAKVVADAKAVLGETMEQVMVVHGIRELMGYVSEPTETQPVEDAFSAPAAGLDLLANITAEDAGWFNLSCRVHALVREQVLQMKNHAEGRPEINAVVRRSDLEDDLYRSLYSNPKYLELVKRTMDVKGAYASPLVSHFVSFYARYLNRSIREYVQEEQADAGFLKERVEGILGKEAASSQHVLPVYNITILGNVLEGHLRRNKKDPEKTDRSFQVDPDIVQEKIVLKEVEDKMSRVLTKGFVWYVFGKNHRIKHIAYVGDT